MEKVGKEYKEREYENIAKILLNDFSIFSDKLEQTLFYIFGKDIQTSFNVYLTKYGVGGSYRLPNEIILNINNKLGVKTVVHEMVHLMIEENVKKYNLKQFQKERTVDLILHYPKFYFYNTTFGKSIMMALKNTLMLCLRNIFLNRLKLFFQNK